jgi:hypothetical protein
MGELYRTGDSDTPSEATPDKPEPGATSDTGHDAQIEAILAREDAMPTREESAAASWGGDTPAEPDEPDPASESDPDLEAVLAREDSMPTREESATAAWGSDLPDGADEEDPDIEYDARTKAILAREDSMPDRQESARATWGDTTTDGHDHDTPAESPLAKEQGVQDTGSWADPLTAATDQTGNERSIPAGDARKPSGTDQLPADTSEPEQLAEDTDRSRVQDAPLNENEGGDQDFDTKIAERNKVSGRHVVSPDNIAIGAALWDAHDAVQKIAAHGMHDAASPLVAVAIGLAGVGLAKYQERRKEKRK